MPQKPSELGARKIWIEQKSGLRREYGLVAAGLEFRAQIRGSPVLPNDCAMDGASGRPVPQESGLALVGYANGDNIARGCADIAKRAPAGFDSRGPEVFGLVFDFAVGRKMLMEFLLGKSGDRGIGPEQNGPCRRRTLIDR